MPDRFPESGTKNAPKYECLHKTWITASDTIRAKIISLRLPYLLFSLPICQAIDQPHLYRGHPIIKVRFGSVRVGLRCLHVKQNGTNCAGFIFVPPADADCWSRAYRIHAEPYKHNPNPICNGIRYAGDWVSCKQGLYIAGLDYQVIPGHGNPQKRRTMLGVIYSNIVALNTILFTRYVRKHPSKKINTKKLPEILFRYLGEP